jgi:hypothetical protein
MIKRIGIACLLLLIPAIGWANSSRENRDESTVFLGISPIGLHIPTLLTHPVGLGVYLGPNWMAGAEYGSFSATFDDGDSKATANYQNIGAYTRWFPGTNSFNLGLAVHRRTFKADAETAVDDPTYGSVDVTGSLKATATVGSLIVGNQWMMDFGLVLALDWVIVSGLISGKTDSKLNGTAVLPDGTVVDLDKLDPKTKRKSERDLSSLGDVVNQASAFPGLLVFTIGWAF